MMRTTVRLLAPTPQTDALGGDVAEYAQVGTFKGRLRTITGRDAQMSGSEGVLLSHKLYAKPGAVASVVTESHRLAIGATIFDVDSVDNVNQAGRLIVFSLSERRPNRYG